MHRLPYFPELYTATNTRTCKYHPWSIIIKQVQEDNELANKVHYDWFCRQPFHGFVFIPKLNICKERKHIYSESDLLHASCHFLGRPKCSKQNYIYHSWTPRSQILNAVVRPSWSPTKGKDFLPKKLSGKSAINHVTNTYIIVELCDNNVCW